MPDLLGEHRYALDPKGRISLPGKFREAFDEGLFLALGHDGCLEAYPKEGWERRRAEVEAFSVTDPRGRAYRRVFMANAERADLDGQGRVVIPQKLRQKASLGKEVVVAGAGDHLEVWNLEAYDRYMGAFEAQYTSGTLVPDRA